MKFYRSFSTSFPALISLILLYITLIVITLLLSRQMLTDLSFAENATGMLVIILTAMFSLFLLGTIIVSILRLIRDKARKRPGSGMKIKLLIFFIIVIILSSVPQIILSLNFITNAMDSWFRKETGEALEGGISIALSYYRDKVNILEEYNDNQLLIDIISDVSKRPSQVWENIKTVTPQVDSLQVFDKDGTNIFFKGTKQAEISSGQMFRMRNGLVSKDTVGDDSFLRIKVNPSEARLFHLIISLHLPEGFDSIAESMTSAFESFQQMERYRSIIMIVILIFYALFAFPLILLAILVSLILSNEITRPIVSLENATKKVAEGDFTVRILSRSHDDVSLLVESFNRMVSELEKSRTKLIQTEKVAAWQEIAQRLAHEIRNPLTPIKLTAERLLRKFKKDPNGFTEIFAKSINSIIAEVDGLNSLLMEFRNFSRLPAPNKNNVHLKSLVSEAATLYSESNPNISISFSDVDDSIVLPVDFGQIKQVFSNLFKNAIEAMDGSGRIFIRTGLVKKHNTDYCRIQVQDSGPGIPAERFSQVFNPYFTTKTHGTGLGLAISERIIFDHKGQIWFETETGQGTTFYIDLPINS
jgi:two-component system, NtrC family, nitrogen regulation sensor histidine kinase NtrY